LFESGFEEAGEVDGLSGEYLAQVSQVEGQRQERVRCTG
jgi:hypothetical protein